MDMANKYGHSYLCGGCGNSDAWVIHYKTEKLTGRRYEECNRCFDSSIPKNPDVYFREPYWADNIHDYDDPTHDRQRGTFITSKAHKAYVLKKCGLQEAGDRRGGTNNFDRIAAKYADASLRK